VVALAMRLTGNNDPLAAMIGVAAVAAARALGM
jgi:hypothetical protein